MTLLDVVFPARSVAVTVNVCVPGKRVSSRKPLGNDSPLSVRPRHLVTAPRSEQLKLVFTSWCSVKTAPGSGLSIVIEGGVPVSTTDWKLTALLKLNPTLPALS